MVTVKITIVEKDGETTTKINILKKDSTEGEYDLARGIFELVATALVVANETQDDEDK